MQEIFFYLGQYCTLGIRLKEFHRCLIQLIYPIFDITLFYSIQKTLLFSTLNSFYKRYRSKIINICTTREENNFIGDGRSDSPGYSAKYGTYSSMSSDLNKVVYFFVVHISTAGNSSRMEKKGLQTLLKNNYTDN